MPRLARADRTRWPMADAKASAPASGAPSWSVGFALAKAGLMNYNACTIFHATEGRQLAVGGALLPRHHAALLIDFAGFGSGQVGEQRLGGLRVLGLGTEV